MNCCGPGCPPDDDVSCEGGSVQPRCFQYKKRSIHVRRAVVADALSLQSGADTDNMCSIKLPDVVPQSSSGQASRWIQAYHKYTWPALDERDALTAVTLTNHQSVVAGAKQKGPQSEAYVPAVFGGALC